MCIGSVANDYLFVVKEFHLKIIGIELRHVTLLVFILVT